MDHQFVLFLDFMKSFLHQVDPILPAPLIMIRRPTRTSNDPCSLVFLNIARS